MNLYKFLSDKVMFILFNILACFGLSAFLLVLGNSISEVMLVTGVWIIVFILYLVFNYQKIKKKDNEVNKILNNLQQTYLIAEVLPKPNNYSDFIYYQVMQKMSKSMNDEIGKIRRQQTDYREYIEEWVHEIKTPISASLLICDNNEFAGNKKLKLELTKVDALVNQTLFYARSEVAEKDYFVKEYNLEDIIHRNILKHRLEFMENNIKIEIHDTKHIVYTDEKWLDFILDQLISNAIKYHHDDGLIKIYGEEKDDGVLLTVFDNGLGIVSADIPRIFDKGFTGSNRQEKRSTGIGLYLAKKLCDKMGHKIMVDSAFGQYTKIMIFFPKGKLNVVGK